MKFVEKHSGNAIKLPVDAHVVNEKKGKGDEKKDKKGKIEDHRKDKSSEIPHKELTDEEFKEMKKKLNMRTPTTYTGEEKTKKKSEL